MRHNSASTFFIATVLLCVAPPLRAATIEVRLTDDTRQFDYEATSDGTGPSQGAQNNLRIGVSLATDSNGDRLASAVFGFPLPAIPVGDVITSVTFSAISVGQTENLPTANGDLYGMPLDPGPTLLVTDHRYYSGPSDPAANVTKLQDNFLPITLADDPGDTTVTSIDIKSYIQSLYTAGAQPGDFAVLRISYDDVPDTDVAVAERFLLRSAGGVTTANAEALKPVLTFTTIPEPAALATVALACLGVRGRSSRCVRDVVYF